MMGKLYGIGLGPGDPGLVTLKGLRILQAADVIFAPKAESGEGGIARTILRQILPEKECLELAFPMVRDLRQLEQHWGEAAALVAAKLAQGLTAAFVTLGDPLLYSTYNYLLEALRRRDAHLAVETVPGITSFNAAAALANLPLVEGNESLALLPAAAGAEAITQALKEFDTVVLMKIGSRLPQVRRLLLSLDQAADAVFVSRAGLEGEAVVRDISQVQDDHLGYLSVIIVRRRKEGR